MEKKVIIIFLIGVLVSLIIYNLYSTKKIDYLVIGDSIATGKTKYNNSSYTFNDIYKESINNINSYNKYYAIENMTSRDLYDLIKQNNKEKFQSIQNLISQAEIITISLGNDELNNNYNINIYIYYMDKVIEYITKLNNKDIYLINLYSEIDKIKEVNQELYNLSKKYNIKYIDIYDIYTPQNTYDESNILNMEGHNKIKQLLENA